MANKAVQDALRPVVEPVIKRLSELDSELSKIDGPIREKVEARKKELRAKADAEADAYGSSLLDKASAEKRTSLAKEKAGIMQTHGLLLSLFQAQTGGRTRVQAGTVDPKSGKMVRKVLSRVTVDGKTVFAFADGSQAEIEDSVFVDDNVRGRVSGPGAKAYDALTDAGLSDGAARTFIDQARNRLLLK